MLSYFKNGVSCYNIVGVLWNFFRGNKLLRELKASVKKLMDAAKNTIPSLAKAMESLRAKMIIFCYQLGYIYKGKGSISKYVDAADPILERYAELKQEIREKSSEQNPFALKRKVPPFLMSKSRWSYLSALQN